MQDEDIGIMGGGVALWENTKKQREIQVLDWWPDLIFWNINALC